MAIFAEVTVNERIIDRHLRGTHPLLDHNASESQSVISIRLKWAYQHYGSILEVCHSGGRPLHNPNLNHKPGMSTRR